jgi:hypothetical protein
MPGARSRWRETELTRAVRAVEKATGAKISRVEVDPTGKIIVFPGGNGGAAETTNPLDNWMATRADANQGN